MSTFFFPSDPVNTNASGIRNTYAAHVWSDRSRHLIAILPLIAALATGACGSSQGSRTAPGGIAPSTASPSASGLTRAVQSEGAFESEGGNVSPFASAPASASAESTPEPSASGSPPESAEPESLNTPDKIRAATECKPGEYAKAEQALKAIRKGEDIGMTFPAPPACLNVQVKLVTSAEASGELGEISERSSGAGLLKSTDTGHAGDIDQLWEVHAGKTIFDSVPPGLRCPKDFFEGDGRVHVETTWTGDGMVDIAIDPIDYPVVACNGKAIPGLEVNLFWDSVRQMFGTTHLVARAGVREGDVKVFSQLTQKSAQKTRTDGTGRVTVKEDGTVLHLLFTIEVRYLLPDEVSAQATESTPAKS